MNNFRKAISVILVMMMLLTAAPLQGFVGLDLPNLLLKANAAKVIGYGSGSGFDWQLDDEGLLTISGRGDGEMSDFPENPNFSFTDYSPWYKYNLHDKVKKVVFVNKITRISSNAFGNCSNLTEIELPDEITAICERTFDGCLSLKSIAIPNSVTSIGYLAFGYCGLENIVIPENVKFIDNSAFGVCKSLSWIALPKALETIGNYAFDYCINLTDVYYAGSEQEWNAINIGSNNDLLLNANIHFNSVAPDDSKDFVETLQYGADRFSFGKNIEGYIGESVNSLVLYESALNDTTALTFSSSNTDVVEIGEIQHGTGEYITLENQHIATVPLIFKSEGTSIITVVSPEGLSSSITVSVKPVVYELKLYSTVSTLLVGKGRSIGAAVELEKNGVPTGEKCEYSFAVSDSDIVSISDVKTSNSDNNTYFTIKGLEEGAAKLTITEQSTGAMYSATVTVNKGILTYNAEALPKYYDGKHECNGIISGMYIDEFVSTQTDDSDMSVSFNVYNTTGLVGVVAVYDADGNLKESLPIKRFDGGIISSVYDTLKECYYLVKDLATGDILSYKQSSYSEKTEIKDIKVPKGGRIEITNDIMYSDACCLLNVSELAINTILLIGDTIKGLSSEEIKKIAEESSVTLLKNKVLEKVPGMAEEFRETVIKSIMSDIGDLAIADALNIITDNVTKIFSDFNIDFTKLVVDSAASVTVGIAEDAFTAATSFVGVALKGMFIAADYLELSAFIMNFAMPRSESVMKIYFDDENGCLSDNGVTIKAENGTADLSESNFVMHSVVISDGDLMADVIKEALDNMSDEYVLRDIYLERDGVISQPDQPVLVSIPVPAGYIDVTLYWVKDDGTLVEIPYTFTGGKYITFRTNHFSYYAIVNSKNENEICKEHIDNDGDFLCDNGCGFEFDKPVEPEIPVEPDIPDEEPAINCSHICHKTGFLGLFAKIAVFFWKLFGINPVCSCGAAHY